jgi:hypothetical protein
MLKFEIYIEADYHFVEYRRHGETHRLNGPATIWHDDLLWFQYGKASYSRHGLPR